VHKVLISTDKDTGFVGWPYVVVHLYGYLFKDSLGHKELPLEVQCIIPAWVRLLVSAALLWWLIRKSPRVLLDLLFDGFWQKLIDDASDIVLWWLSALFKFLPLIFVIPLLICSLLDFPTEQFGSNLGRVLGATHHLSASFQVIIKLVLKHLLGFGIPTNSFVCSLLVRFVRLAILLNLPVDYLAGIIKFSCEIMLVPLVTSHGFCKETLVVLHIFLVFRLFVMKISNTSANIKLFSSSFGISSWFINLFLVFWKFDLCSSSCYFFADSALIPAFDFFPLFELDFGYFLNVLELCGHVLAFFI